MVAWLASTLCTYLLAALFHTQRVLAELQGLGVSIPIDQRIKMTLHDMAGLSAYAVVIGVGLLLAMSVFSVFYALKWLKGPVWYVLAGAIAMATILLSMWVLFSFTPIAGARGILGIVLQLLAGSVGGWVFARLMGVSHPAEASQSG